MIEGSVPVYWYLTNINQMITKILIINAYEYQFSRMLIIIQEMVTKYEQYLKVQTLDLFQKNVRCWRLRALDINLTKH